MNSLYIQTPLIESPVLSRLCNARVMLKLEALQPSGSFKNRGIGRLCQQHASKDRARCFISSSGGNAGLAVAYSGRILGVPVKVVIPKTTSGLMLQKIQDEGAEVIVHGSSWLEADKLAREYALQPGSFYIPPFDHPVVWEGHATLVYEMASQGVKPDAVCLAVGGGGLFCGVVQGLHEAGWSDTTVYTAETEGAATLAKSIEAGRQIVLDSISTVATSLGAPYVAEKALEWCKVHRVVPKVVTDNMALDACLRFADHHRLMVEPACGAALSLIYSGLLEPSIHRTIVVIVCGGNIVSRKLMQEWEQSLKA